MATADASLKKVQAKGVTNPVQLAMLAGKPESQAAAAPLTAFQNILVVRACSVSTGCGARSGCVVVQPGQRRPVGQPTKPTWALCGLRWIELFIDRFLTIADI